MKRRLAHWSRHVRLVVRYASLRKASNLGLAYFNYLRGAALVSNLPAFLKVEISRDCKIFCKYCMAAKEERFFPLGDYKQLIDRFADCAFLVSLYDVGEPLLNEDVLEYIRHAHDRRVGTVISTSLSLARPTEFWESLVASGLDRLIAGIDGVSQEVYQQYRAKGDLGLAMSNLKTLVRCKESSGSRMTIEWQMIDLPWNKQEQEPARRMAREIGCDAFRVIPEVAMPRRRRLTELANRNHNCLLPYILFLVDVYGRVRSCYKNYEIPMFVGSLDNSSFEQIWNGPEMISIRDKRQIRHRLGCGTCDE